MDKPIRHVDIHRALKVILGINYNYRFLDVFITPQSTMWYAAVQFRNDPQKRWHPRIMIFYPGTSKVAVLERLGVDAEALMVDASTILSMAETRAQSPQPDPDKLS